MSSSLGAQDVQSIYGLLVSASNKDPNKLKYRLLHLPKHAPKAIHDIESVNLIKSTLPKGLQETLSEVMDMYDKSLISTTSINSGTMNMLTTNRQRIEVSDPRARRNFLQKMGGRGGGGGGDE